jgi:hypothetical protein
VTALFDVLENDFVRTNLFAIGIRAHNFEFLKQGPEHSVKWTCLNWRTSIRALSWVLGKPVIKALLAKSLFALLAFDRIDENGQTDLTTQVFLDVIVLWVSYGNHLHQRVDFGLHV